MTCWLEQAYQELLEGWESTEGESYAERYHVRTDQQFSKGVGSAGLQCHYLIQVFQKSYY